MSAAPRGGRRAEAARNDVRVLRAAREVLTVHPDAPMSDIAGRAGVGVGTLYRHFATREELLGELVYRSFGIAVENARAAASHPGSALEGVRHFFLATLRDRDSFVLPLPGGPPIFTDATRERQKEVREILRELIDRGRAARELRDDLTPEDLILAASLLSRPLPGLAPSLASGRRSATAAWDRLARRQIDLMIEGLGAG
jgi:AcrR family transcriptional regulator